MLFQDRMKFVESIDGCRVRALAVERRESLLNVLKKGKGNTTSKGIICHTHKDYPILANVMKEISVIDKCELRVLLRGNLLQDLESDRGKVACERRMFCQDNRRSCYNGINDGHFFGAWGIKRIQE